MSETTDADRRQTTRYALKNDFYLAFWPYLDRVGKVRDVSMSGAAFEYPVYEEYEELAEVKVDIFSSEPSHFLLLHVPCKIVYDVGVERGAVAGIETRRCGVRFEELSPQHSAKLKLLLGNFISHPLPNGATGGQPNAGMPCL